jgi:hypothetical protein
MLPESSLGCSPGCSPGMLPGMCFFNPNFTCAPLRRNASFFLPGIFVAPCVGLVFPAVLTSVLALCWPSALALRVGLALALWRPCVHDVSKYASREKSLARALYFALRISLAPLCGEMRVLSCRAFMLHGKPKTNIQLDSTQLCKVVFCLAKRSFLVRIAVQAVRHIPCCT